MGIPYYFYVLTKKYDSILLENITFNIDILCFDFNGIIHPISAKNNKTFSYKHIQEQKIKQASNVRCTQGYKTRLVLIKIKR